MEKYWWDNAKEVMRPDSEILFIQTLVLYKSFTYLLIKSFRRI